MMLNAGNKPIGLGAGIGMLAALVFIGFITSLFLLWSVSCIGGGAILLAGGFC